MRQVIELMERCASSVAAAHPDDLSLLAQLHTDLLSVRLLTLEDEQHKSADALPQAANNAELTATLVERLILRDVENAEDTLAQINQRVKDLLALVAGPTPASPPTASAPSTKALAPSPAAHPAIAEEKQITEDDAPLAIEFVGEAVGHLDSAEASLLKLEEDPTDADEVNAVFRAFHTIKGVAGFLELKQIGALAHAAETLLDLARKGKTQLVGPRLDVVLEARDAMRQMVDAVESAAKSTSVPGKQEGLAALLQRLEAATHGGAIPASAAGPAPAPAPSAPSSPSAAPTQTTPGPEPVAPPIQTPAPAPSPTPDHATEPAHPAVTATANSADGVVKVSTSRLDTLIDAVGELVIAQAMVAQDLVGGAAGGDQRLMRNLSQLGKITRGLQDLSMSMRMVPIAGVFQKMARMTRDLARKAGKDVEFVQVGGE
ncbi:MAG: Hpt domain-containing protein, partial [Tepidisphaeraceae bacterium]